jgi:hypothetical protein
MLFASMVVSAQMRLGGFYDWVTRRLAELPRSRRCWGSWLKVTHMGTLHLEVVAFRSEVQGKKRPRKTSLFRQVVKANTNGAFASAAYELRA